MGNRASREDTTPDKAEVDKLNLLRNQRWMDMVPAAIYSVLLLILFRRIFFTGDEQQVYFAWDTIAAYWPDFAYRFRSIWQGEWPLWNPYENGGMPYALRTQAMLYYPPSWLLVLFALPHGQLSLWGMQVFILLHFLVLALGAHGLARHIGAAKTAAYFAGITAVMAAPVLSHRNSNFLYPLVWLPWLLTAIDTVIENPNRKTALRVTVLGILAGSAASPPGVFNVVWTAALFAMASLPWFLGKTWFKRGPQEALRHAKQLALFGFVAVVLTLCYLAIVYLPATELLEQSSRAKRGMSYLLDRALQIKHLPSLLNAHHPQTWWFDLFVGIPTLVALVPALLIKPDRRAWILTAISLLSVWVAIGGEGGLLAFAIEHGPGFSINRKAYRYAVVFGILAGPLAARGITMVLEAVASRGDFGMFASRKQNRIYAALTLFISLAAILYFAPDIPKNDLPNTILGARLVRWEAVGICILLGLGLAVPQLGSRLVFVSFLLILGIHVVHLHWSASDRLELNRPFKQAKENRYVERLPTTSIQWRLGIQGPQAGFGSRELKRYAGGYKLPMQLSRHRSFMQWANKHPQRLRLFNVRFFLSKRRPGAGARRVTKNLWEIENPVPLVVHYSAVQRVTNGQALSHWAMAENRGRALVEDRDWSKELDSLATERGERTTGKLVGYSANKIAATVTARAPGLVVFNEVYFPGWRVFVDGKESQLFRCNHLLRGVVVGPGKHHIDLHYWPRHYGWLTVLMLLSLGGCILLARGPLISRQNRVSKRLW